MTKRIFGLIFAICLIFSTGAAHAKDLTNRIGLGYNNQINAGWIGGAPAAGDVFAGSHTISAKYWIDRNLGVEPFFGFFRAETDDMDGWATQLGAKVPYNLIEEANMNFYAGGGLGIIAYDVDYDDDRVEGDDDVGFALMAFTGMEFFLPGLPNLAFDAEFGLQYLNVGDYSQFGTYGGGFGIFGIRYYF